MITRSNSFIIFSSKNPLTINILFRKLLKIIFLFICITFTFILFIYTFGYTNFEGIYKIGKNDKFIQKSLNETETIIIIITPTYKRLERLAEMTRLSQTLMHIKNIKWIVIEDGIKTIPAVERILSRSGIDYIYFATTTKEGFPLRGWSQRNEALKLIRNNYKNYENNAVIYFADDDNTYDIRLFNNYIRKVETIGVWAVGLVGGASVEAPYVKKGKVKGWHAMGQIERTFEVDMAGFAVNLQLILRSDAAFQRFCRSFEPETCFLVQLGIPLEMLQPFGCEDDFPKELFVWHTKSIKDYPNNGSNYGYIIEEKINKIDRWKDNEDES